jgi:hypothetical protein
MEFRPAEKGHAMDSNFLEFWGNFLLNAARGQKHMEDMEKWMQQGFKGFDDMTTLFRKIYGLETHAEGSPDYQETWEKAQRDFKKSFNDYLSLLGVVPRDDYLNLISKYEDLKEKVASQEETIKHLRMLLSSIKGADYDKAAGQFDDLLQKQTEQFQNLMDNLGQMFTKDVQTHGAGEGDQK